MLRPQQCVVPFEATGLPLNQQQCERYVWIPQGAKGGRQHFVPLNTRDGKRPSPTPGRWQPGIRRRTSANRAST